MDGACMRFTAHLASSYNNAWAEPNKATDVGRESMMEALEATILWHRMKTKSHLWVSCLVFVKMEREPGNLFFFSKVPMKDFGLCKRSNIDFSHKMIPDT